MFTPLLTNVNAISPASAVEGNLQTVSSIYLQSAVSQNYILTSAQLNSLRVLASKCPFIDGTGVYEARAMLVAYDGLKLYNDSCLLNEQQQDTNDDRRMKERNKENLYYDANLTIYPNPNNGSFTMNYQLGEGQTGKVILLNAMGQIVGEYILNNSSGKMQINNPDLVNGVYVYQLHTSDNTMKVGKVIIIK
jgi:hypothetical protein